MTDKEQKQELTKIINECCEAELGQVQASSMGGKVIKTTETSLIAKDIYNAGFRKERICENYTDNNPIDEFIKSAENQEFVQTKKTLRDIAPFKVKKVLKEFIGESKNGI